LNNFGNVGENVQITFLTDSRSVTAVCVWIERKWERRKGLEGERKEEM